MEDVPAGQHAKQWFTHNTHDSISHDAPVTAVVNYLGQAGHQSTSQCSTGKGIVLEEGFHNLGGIVALLLVVGEHVVIQDVHGPG